MCGLVTEEGCLMRRVMVENDDRREGRRILGSYASIIYTRGKIGQCIRQVTHQAQQKIGQARRNENGPLSEIDRDHQYRLYYYCRSLRPIRQLSDPDRSDKVPACRTIFIVIQSCILFLSWVTHKNTPLDILQSLRPTWSSTIIQQHRASALQFRKPIGKQ